jgi:hypothetical protein
VDARLRVRKFGHDTPIAVGDLLHDALRILLEHIYCDSVLRDNSFRVAGRIYPSSELLSGLAVRECQHQFALVICTTRT